MSNPDNNAATLDNSLLPAPGATERKKATPAIAAKPHTVRPRKLLSPSELTIEENNYKIKYPHITSGTLTNATKDNPTEGLTPEEVTKYRHKRSCEIQCQFVGADGVACQNTRRIATSDLAQVKLCDECTRIARNQRKRERRALAKTKK